MKVSIISIMMHFWKNKIDWTLYKWRKIR